MNRVEGGIHSKFEALEFFITTGTQKKIAMHYCGDLGGYTKKQYRAMGEMKPKHRAGTHWLKGDFLFVADRALRIFINMFGIEKLDRILTEKEYRKLCTTYMTVYPMDDEMSTNRMHYLIDSIRRQDVVLHEACKCCGQPYVTHRDECFKRKCNVCDVHSDGENGDIFESRFDHHHS